MKIFQKIKYFLIPSALLLHISLIYLRGYFLSGEFTLYPYLVSRGFLPYRDLIDQHFPTLLFGPFSLPAILTTNPWPLMGVFLFVLCLTDIFLYLTLIRFKVNNPFVWLVLFIVSATYFSGNILWLETFVNLLLSLWMFLTFSKNKLRQFASGFLLSQILLLRPTIAPALLVLILSFSTFSYSLVLGGIIGLAIPTLFIVWQGIFVDFFRQVILFNQQVYPQEAQIFPAKRQAISLLLWLGPVIYSVIKNKKYQYLIIIFSLLFLGYPRFGFEHLQPLFLLAIIFWALLCKKPSIVVIIMIVFFFILNMISSIRHPYGNYYLTPEIKTEAEQIKSIPGIYIYFLGVPDILYQLTNKIPPQYTYIPSLPWYLYQIDFQNKIINSLKDSKSPVLVNFQAEVDGKNIVVESGKLIEYIKMNYTEAEKIGRYQLFLPQI